MSCVIEGKVSPSCSDVIEQACSTTSVKIILKLSISFSHKLRLQGYTHKQIAKNGCVRNENKILRFSGRQF